MLLLTQGVLALPMPMKLTEQTFTTQSARNELTGWVKGLQSAGVPVTRKWVRSFAIDFSTEAHGWVAWVQRPMRPVRRHLGIDQSWALFAAPDTWPSTMTVEIETAAGWQTIYHSLQPDKRSVRAPLRFRRIRGVHDTATTSGTVRQHFVDWVGRTVFAAHPDATKMRLRVTQSESLPPGKPANPRSRTSLNILRERPGVAE